MSRKTFPLGPISISLLAALTGFAAVAKAQDQQPDQQPVPVQNPADVKTEAPKAPNPTEPKETKTDSAPDAKKERITVTGSRIRRQIDDEGPKPVVTIQADEIKKSGATTVNEYLDKLTIASFGTSSYGSGYGAPEGTQGFDIHGLGEGNTLVLLNGRRLVRDPYLEIIDLSVIPVAAVDHVDVLKGTASAIYGTDAAGGVVNVVTRKNYDGFAFGGGLIKNRWKGAGGDHVNGYVVGGTSSDKSQNLMTLQWDEDKQGWIGNRPWVDKNYRSVYGYPFSYYNANQQLTPGGACGATRVVAGDTTCSFNYMDQYEMTAPAQKLTLLDDFNYDLTKNTHLGARFFVTRKTARTHGLQETVDPASDGYFVSSAALAQNHPEITDALAIPDANHGGANGTPVEGRLIAGPATSTLSDQLTMSGTASITHDFDNGSTLELAFTDSRINRNHTWLNYFDNERLSDAIWDGSYDVFSPNPGSLDPYRLDVPDRDYSIARSTELNYNGNFSLFGHDWGYAVGASQIYESYRMETSDNKIAGLIKGLGGGSASGDRRANAVYGELQVPIVSTLEATIAARWDKYTDFGGTFNPALGLQYRLGKEFFARANYGTGFKAPTLRDVHDSPATFFTSAFDHKQCNAATASGDATAQDKYCNFGQSAKITQGGNPDLNPEKSRNVDVELSYEPIAGYGLSLEYYWSQIKDQIGSVSAEKLTQLEGDGRALPAGTAINRDPITGDIVSFVSPTTNLGGTRTSGLESSLYAKQQFGFGTLAFRTNYSYVLSYKSQTLPGDPWEELLDVAGYPTRWRWNNTFGYSYGINDVALTSRSIGKRDKGQDIYGHLGAYTQWDLNYGVDITKYATLNVGGENIFNQQPQHDESDRVFRGGGVDPTYYVKADFRM